jgi:RluA family pseudouridine synthase
MGAFLYTACVKTIAPDRILYEDDALLVVNKRSGELVVAGAALKQTGRDRPKQALYDFLHKVYPGLRVVHRLDFATSGVVVFAKGAPIVMRIREQGFADWKKTYRALVAGKMEEKEGTIARKLPSRSAGDPVEAVTRYRTLALFPKASFVECVIETGRRHQIRKHLQMIGHPLLLDPLYGDPRVDRAFKRKHRYRRFFLHAFALSFPHPVTGKLLTVRAPLPDTFEELLGAMRGR